MRRTSARGSPATAENRPLIFLNARERTSAPLNGDMLLGLLIEIRHGDWIGIVTLPPDGLAGQFAAFLYTWLQRTTAIAKAMPGAT
jgi:hypothetical protein